MKLLYQGLLFVGLFSALCLLPIYRKAAVQAELGWLGQALPAAVDVWSPIKPHASEDTVLRIWSPDWATPKWLPIDGRSSFYLPLAMMLALGVAGGLNWWRTLAALAAVHAFGLLTLAAVLAEGWWNEAGDTLTYTLAARSAHVLGSNLWLAFVAPAVAWLALGGPRRLRA